MADSRYTKNNASTGQVWSEAYADNLDNQLDALSKRFWYVDDQTWVTQNAVYNGTGWDRIDTGKPAIGIRLDVLNNIIQVMKATAGSNPITTGIAAITLSMDKTIATDVGVYLPCEGPDSPENRVGTWSGTYRTQSTGTSGWYVYGSSYTVPLDYVRGRALLKLTQSGGTSRVTQNGSPVTPGVIDIAPGDVFRLEYDFVISTPYNATAELFIYEVPVFLPRSPA
jgi:hypothetical protein